MKQHVTPLRVLVGCCLAAGCESAPRTSVMTSEDYQEISAQMAERLLTSPPLADRSKDAPQMVVTITKVQNLTSTIIPVGEQWYIQARVVNSPPMADFARRTNMIFVIPAERLLEVRDWLRDAQEVEYLDDRFGSERRPTHAMTAVFRSITRSDERDRTDLYQCEYQIVELASGEILWSDAIEFKREAAGRSWD